MAKCINKKYPLGPKYEGVVLNHREAMCMQYLLKRLHVSQMAKLMRLTPRTINFYIENVMHQLKCHSLLELVDCIKKSELRTYFN